MFIEEQVHTLPRVESRWHRAAGEIAAMLIVQKPPDILPLDPSPPDGVLRCQTFHVDLERTGQEEPVEGEEENRERARARDNAEPK